LIRRENPLPTKTEAVHAAHGALQILGMVYADEDTGRFPWLWFMFDLVPALEQEMLRLEREA
jgi:hypothetical protein